MKFNKWTVGLAALGVVSLVSARADEAPAAAPAAAVQNYLETSTKGISISGYVDTSVEWAMYPGTERSAESPIGAIPFRSGVNSSKQDGFNMNVVELNIEKPLDEAPAASGFKIQLIAGPDAEWYNQNNPNDPNSYADNGFAIKQAYVAVRAPVGNGIDFKIGVFDTIIGYEVFESGSNPNFTRSWGYNLEPTEHEGILASYKVNDNISASFGIANTLSPGIEARNNKDGPGGFDSFWCKTYMASLTLTAPQSWGFLGGSALYAGFVQGFSTAGDNSPNLSLDDDQLNFYMGAVINTPVAGLTAGLAYDYVDYSIARGPGNAEINNIGVYSTYKVTEKLSVSGRYEYGWRGNSTSGTGTISQGDLPNDTCYWGLTGTIQYDIWQNVISRLEIRHEEDSSFTESCGTGLYLNLIYKF